MVLRALDGRRFHLTHLLRMAQHETETTQYELGEKLGVSRRTIIRWGRNATSPAPFQVQQLADLVRATGNDDLADALLEAANLPIPEPPVQVVEAPSPAPSPEPVGPPPQHLMDAVIYAAADAADLAPRKTRLALRAALLRARELGVTAEAMVEALGAG
jgi:DNA-binding XRE family transcriptional regulator